MTPLKSIRKNCIQCSCSPQEVKLCVLEKCALYPFKSGKKTTNCSVLKAIKAYCKECGEGTYKAVKECEFTECPLYELRLGKKL